MNNLLNLDSKPHVQYFFLCDAVQQHDDRRIDVSGLLSDWLFTDLTERMQPVKIDALLVIGIHTQDRFRSYNLRVTAAERGKTEATALSSQIGLVDGEFTPIKCQRIDITFSSPGIYWLNAYLDGDLVARYPLTVEYAQMSPS